MAYECIYCSVVIDDDEPVVPKASDDIAWDELAKAHDSNCEWIRTRAHQRDVDENATASSPPAG